LQSQLETSLGGLIQLEIGDILSSMMNLFEEIFKNFKSSMDELELVITNSIKE